MLGQKSKTCVLKCNGNVALHAFPRDLVGRSVWLKQLGLKQAPNHAFACDRHFSSKMKTKGVSETRITAWAIPDQNLPEVLGDSTDDEDFPEDEPYIYEKPPDVHLNGFAKKEVVLIKDDGEEQMNNGNHITAEVENKSPMDEEPIDFDELLAKVHCITDLNKSNEKPNGILAHATDESLDALGTEVNTLDEGMLNASLTLNNEVPNGNNVSAPSAPIEISSKFKRRLISSVRRRRILYDPAHPLFSNIQKKKRAWEGIGRVLHLNGIVCRELWLNMRYDYQIHVRNLRQWLAGESTQRERPRISFENDLLFLWRHIPEKSYCGESDDETLQFQNVSETAAITEQFNSIVVRHNLTASRFARAADHAYANRNTDESVQFACDVIEAVKFYPEIYDCNHPNYGDAKRKSIIWEAISNELHAKASKCLWTWIVQQMRYEFEIIHQKSSYLSNRMDFLKEFIIPNEKSPFKRINSLTNEWFEPMITFSEIQALIQCFIASKKTRPFFVHICTPELVKQLQPPCWSIIGRDLKRKAEQCEVTWVAIQTMFCEISELRRNNCPLCDEWEFESIIKKLLSSLLKTTKIIRVRDFADIPVKKRKTDEEAAIQESKPDDNKSDAVETISLDPPPKPLNEIKFTIPGVATDTNTPTESQLVRFSLDRPISELPDKSVVEIDSVLKDAHIVIFTNANKKPNIYLFTPQLRKELIAEIMCRPLLFNEPCKLSRLTKQFWGEISIGLRYPAEVCTFFWDYIVEKLYFVDYDRTFKKSRGIKWLPPPNAIFAKFEKYANSRNWSEYVTILPEFFQEISYLPLIYVDLKVNSTWNRRQCHARDIAEAWSILGRKYAVLDNHRLLWEKFKQVYLLYLSEMEINIYNPWPKFWVPVFEKMTFLFEHRYSPKDPIYYVIKYKIQDEVVQHRRTKPLPVKLDPITNGKAIFRLLKENEYVEDFTWVNRARFVAKMKTFPMLYDVNHPLFGNKEAKLEAWQEMSLFFHCTVGECHLIFQHLMKGFLLLRARDPNHSCRVNAKYWENMTYIYMCAVPNSIDPTAVEWRTFRDASNGSTIKLAEEFQAEISVIDAKPRLVLKNLAAAVNSMPLEIQGRVMKQIKRVFAEYTRLHNEDVVVDV